MIFTIQGMLERLVEFGVIPLLKESNMGWIENVATGTNNAAHSW